MSESQALKALELGRLYAERGEFDIATEHLLSASRLFFDEKNFSGYLKSQNILLRIYSERMEYDKIHAAKEKLQDLVLKEGFELGSKTYYTLAICAFNKQQFDVALDYLQKSLAIALSTDEKEDICYSIYGLAMVYTVVTPSRLEEALKEIYNLQVFYQFLDIPDLKMSTLTLNAAILQQSKKYDEALNLCWTAYEELKNNKNIYLGLNLLYRIASIYFDMGDKDMARIYAQLAKKSVDPKNFIRLSAGLNELIQKIGGISEGSFDLVFNEEEHVITERKMGKVDFKNQFILLDLLKLFMKNQGVVYTKEFLVEHVWKQSYDPAVHDNKIYVTIKRLRKLIEPDYEKPKYIFRICTRAFSRRYAVVGDCNL
jgi:tetratricopeptide (TPR) repeat protein